MLLSSATINSLCRKDNRRNDDATTTAATTNSHALLQQPWRSKPRCSTAMFDSSVRQFCSTVLLNSSTLAGFCYCARIASAIALMSFATINQICLDDKLSYATTNGLCLQTAIRQANMAKPICFYNATKRRQATTDSLFQAANGPADRPM
jgi:hypothetical protein